MRWIFQLKCPYQILERKGFITKYKTWKIENGILNGNESIEKVFEGFSKQAYVITYRVIEEEHPVDIKLKVKVEILPEV